MHKVELWWTHQLSGRYKGTSSCMQHIQQMYLRYKSQLQCLRKLISHHSALTAAKVRSCQCHSPSGSLQLPPPHSEQPVMLCTEHMPLIALSATSLVGSAAALLLRHVSASVRLVKPDLNLLSGGQYMLGLAAWRNVQQSHVRCPAADPSKPHHQQCVT